MGRDRRTNSPGAWEIVKTSYFIDTNIVMYARGKTHPYKEPCTKLILKIADGSFEKNFGPAVTDSEVFQEIMYRYALVNKWSTALLVCRDVHALGLEVLSVGWSEIDKMLELARKYIDARITPRDLVHAAVMLTNGIRNVISTDAHFDLITEVKRFDPAKL